MSRLAAVDADQRLITIRNPGGERQYRVAEDARLMRRGAPAVIGDCRTGDPLMFAYEPSQDSNALLLIRRMMSPPRRPK